VTGVQSPVQVIYFTLALPYHQSSSIPINKSGLSESNSFSQFLLLGLGWVSHLWFGFGFGKFPLKISNFSIFPLLIKKYTLGWVKKYPGQRQVDLLLRVKSMLWLGQGLKLYPTGKRTVSRGVWSKNLCSKNSRVSADFIVTFDKIGTLFSHPYTPFFTP